MASSKQVSRRFIEHRCQLNSASILRNLGYNFMDFEDNDIAYDNSTQEGAYFRLRFKFDKYLFKRNDPRQNNRLIAKTTL